MQTPGPHPFRLGLGTIASTDVSSRIWQISHWFTACDSFQPKRSRALAKHQYSSQMAMKHTSQCTSSKVRANRSKPSCVKVSTPSSISILRSSLRLRGRQAGTTCRAGSISRNGIPASRSTVCLLCWDDAPDFSASCSGKQNQPLTVVMRRGSAGLHLLS